MTSVWRIGYCPSPPPTERALLALLGWGSTLWVPSFVEPGENNLILNPAHPQYHTIRLSVERQPFQFDPRLF